VEETVEFQRTKAADRDAGVAFGWLIRARKSHLVLGMIGLRTEKHTAHLGYCLARDAWGQGYATEAARAVVAMGQQVESLWRIQATCNVENAASGRVLEKAGLSCEGTLRRHIVLTNLGDVPRDVHCFAIVRDADGNWT
jgi:RimJ/RimL family protein N-acetyltransferase